MIIGVTVDSRDLTFEGCQALCDFAAALAQALSLACFE